jgi:hypothetical protein
MKVAISLATAFIFAMETPANADSYTVTGNQLLAMCVGEQNLFSQGICYGYVMAVADHFLASQVPESLRICLASGVTRKQIADVTIAFLQSHPEKRHYIAHGIVWEALHNATTDTAIFSRRAVASYQRLTPARSGKTGGIWPVDGKSRGAYS